MKIYKQNGELVQIEKPKPIEFKYHWSRATGTIFLRNSSIRLRTILKEPTNIKEIHFIARIVDIGGNCDLMRVVFHEAITDYHKDELFLGEFNSGTYDPAFISP